MICNHCGTENADGTQFCRNCGAQLNAAQPNNMGYDYTQQTTPVYVQPTVPPEYKPISMWGYFGYELLFSIPCVGFILLLVFAFGGTSNINVKNFARSYFCLLIVVAVIVAALVLYLQSAVLYY